MFAEESQLGEAAAACPFNADLKVILDASERICKPSKTVDEDSFL